ncbi:MAG: LamG domain-containing protein [bacterium]|nr:LamG domain-containing protein [bacterium]
MRVKFLSMLCVMIMLSGFFAITANAAGGYEQDGLVTWFPFNETSGDISYNMVNSADGYHMDEPVHVEGQVAGGIQLDGSNDYIVVDNHPNFNFGTGDFSIAAWIKTGDTYGNIVSKRYSHNSIGYLFMVYNGRLLLQMTDDINGWFNYYSDSSFYVADNNWHHVAVTVDRDNSAGGKMYVDGNVVFTFNPMSRSGNIDTSADLWIGQKGGGGYFFDGIIDELAMYKVALSADQIEEIMGADDTSLAISDFSLLATNSIYMRTGSVVNSGNAGVVNAGAGPWLNGGSEVALSSNVHLADNVSIYADKIKMKYDTSVDDVYYNSLTNYGDAAVIRGNETSPLALPLGVTLPQFPAPQPGSSDIYVGEFSSSTLSPGAYGEVVLGKKGTLFLTGGTYHFQELNLGDYAEVRFQTASEVIINNRLASGKNIIIAPAAGAAINAGDIAIYVNGINGFSGTLADSPKAATIGIRHQLKANLYAPNGTLWLKARGNAEGSFIAKDVMVEFYVKITLMSSWQ